MTVQPTPQAIIQEFQSVLNLESQALQSCSEALNHPEQSKELSQAVELFFKAVQSGGKIVVTGIGKSGKVGQKISATLASTGNPAIFLHPTEGLHGDLGVVTPNDAVLAISYTGNTEELIRLLPSLQSRKVPIVGLGRRGPSKLRSFANAWIDGTVDKEACPHNLAPTTSTTLALALGDAIAVTLMKLRGFQKESFALNHPGGSLGKRLKLTVADLMYSGDSVGTVRKDSPMEQVITTLTEKNLGAILVTEGSSFLGIITEGDLRRALNHKERFFEMTAQDIMCTDPISAIEQSPIAEALDLMENGKRQVHVLPVLTPQKEWKGILRLHDVVQSI